MKRNLILFILLCAVGQIVGQKTKSVILRYDDSDFSVIEEKGILYISAPSYDFSYDQDTLAPALPHIFANILVAANMEYESHFIAASSETLLWSNVTIAPYTMPVPTNSSLVTKSSLYHNLDYKKDFPENNTVEYVGTYMVGGFKYLRFKVYPLKYVSATKKVYLKNNLQLKLSLVAKEIKSSAKTNWHLREAISRLVVNRGDLDSLYPKTKLSQRSTPSTLNDSIYEYIILTCDSLKNEFQKLADWKTKKGVRTKVITVEDIYATISGTTQQLKIKQALKDYYDSSDHFLQYVLLAGDNEIIPTTKSKFRRSVNGSIEFPNITTDMFYACFGNMDWDINGNGIIEGEIDPIVYVPEIIVTRLSVNSVSDARHQVERIIRYERQPELSNWENNILVGGMTLDDQLYGEDRLSNTHIKCERFFYPNYIQNFWPQGIKYMFYDTGTSFEGGRLYHFRTGNLQEQLSKGYSFIHLETHGDPCSWLMEYRPEAQPPKQLYYSSDALQVCNSGNTIITTAACLTNAFDSIPTSLGEAFMRNPEAGIIAYYGSTHYGWYYRNLNMENPTSMYIGKFYKNLFSDHRHQIGRAIYASKMEYQSDKWHLTSMNALCDPEMPVFINRPSVFENISISLDNENLTVSTGEQNCRICISSYDDCGESYYSVTDEVNSQAYNTGNTACNVCVTKSGFIPYTAVVGTDVYIQNETYEAQTEVRARNISAGKNVTTIKPTGSVIIRSGKVKMNATDSITLSEGFEVMLGAELEITTGN